MPQIDMLKVLDFCQSLQRPPGDAHDKRYNEGINYAADEMIKNIKNGNFDVVEEMTTSAGAADEQGES